MDSGGGGGMRGRRRGRGVWTTLRATRLWGLAADASCTHKALKVLKEAP